MVRRSRYEIVYAPEVYGHLETIDYKHHHLLKRVIDEQLTYTPEIETRNRKPLDQPAPFDATWEVRCGPNNRFRILYDIDSTEHVILILAVGVKVGNRLYVGGEEVEL